MRTDEIKSALIAYLEQHRAELDAVNDLRCLKLDLKFKPGSWKPRAIVMNTERETVLDGQGPR